MASTRLNRLMSPLPIQNHPSSPRPTARTLTGVMLAVALGAAVYYGVQSVRHRKAIENAIPQVIGEVRKQRDELAAAIETYRKQDRQLSAHGRRRRAD